MASSSLDSAAEPTTTVMPDPVEAAPPVDVIAQLRARSEQLAVDSWLREVART
jgi:hypothetical protein